MNTPTLDRLARQAFPDCPPEVARQRLTQLLDELDHATLRAARIERHQAFPQAPRS